MSFSLAKFLKTLAITLFLGCIAVAGLRAFGIFGKGEDTSGSPQHLAQEAARALEAVRVRQPGERRPASYDAVLAPLDALLRQSRELLESETFDPVKDYEKVRALTLPVVDIAAKADAQAKSETGFITKEYRFSSQRAEAVQYLASTMWERMNRQLPQSSGFFNEAASYPAGEMRELKQILDEGIRADPENAELHYTRGIVNRAEGLFVPAARDLERSVALDPNQAGAWNTLGLVRINLKQFDKARDALEHARAVALEQARDFNLEDPGPEYTAILYNLATFHEGLATYYSRENRVTPTVEYQHLMQEHSSEARKYFQEFLSREPASSPDAAEARGKMQSLP